MKIKGSQGHKWALWVKAEHPFTAISPDCEVHANHNQAQNTALRRRVLIGGDKIYMPNE